MPPYVRHPAMPPQVVALVLLPLPAPPAPQRRMSRRLQGSSSVMPPGTAAAARPYRGMPIAGSVGSVLVVVCEKDEPSSVLNQQVRQTCANRRQLSRTRIR
jgi:hypothetical protein